MKILSCTPITYYRSRIPDDLALIDMLHGNFALQAEHSLRPHPLATVADSVHTLRENWAELWLHLQSGPLTPGLDDEELDDDVPAGVVLFSTTRWSCVWMLPVEL